ncbi:MAG TPA: GntR family transcriptional regulator [Pseudonocardiaceae bacterium]|nr:GntR family transcriptional regulator [Pseudonocardiaceae bacterium]
MVDSAYLALRRDIVSGEIKPGEKLVEVVLADRYGVSRTPIREALRRLEQDDLVQRNGRRMRARQHRPDEILDIYEVRIVLEEAAARAAALHRTPLQVSLLARAHEAMRAVPPDDSVGRERTCWEFHELVWTASHSRTLDDLLNRLQLNLLRYPDSLMTHPAGWRQALSDYHRLVSAIRENRSADAGEIVGARLRAARDLRFRHRADVGVPVPVR